MSHKIENLVELLSQRDLTISSAESLTGGLFASKITSVSGASKVFKGSVVSYATDVKINVLNVPKDVVDKYGVISEECATHMCEGVAKLMQTDVAVSFTGNAGPNTMDNKSVGYVCIAIYIKGVKTLSFTLEALKGDRQEIREKCVNAAIGVLITSINCSDKGQS